MTKVELFEAIRRNHLIGGKSVRAIARERGVHRRVVRQALADAVPPPRKKAEREWLVLTTSMRAQVDEWLEADRKAPRKQRHTARRIFKRLRDEMGYQGAESTVRFFVGGRRRELAIGKQVFLPLGHAPGGEGEVDWYEYVVRFPSGEEVVQGFCMRACHSGREFHMAFPRQTQQAFLEAHVEAFAYFGGVFETMRYDNLKSAVKRVLRGRRRIESDRFIAMRSHYVFASEFCIPGEQGAHEKGGVEGGLGRFRRNHLVPVPEVADFAALNRLLLDGCVEDDLRTIDGRQEPITTQWQREMPRLKTLPDRSFDTAEVDSLGVNSKALVTLRTNRYSVPVRFAHRRVEYRLHAMRVEFVADGKVVAVHLRSQGRHGLRVELDHYLELLWHKPGALTRSLPLQQARERGSWPTSYDELHAALIERYSAAEAARQLLAVLMLHREARTEDVHAAVAIALQHGCYDAGAVAVLMRQQKSACSVAAPLTDLGDLHRFDRPTLDTTNYDRLLSRRKGQQVH